MSVCFSLQMKGECPKGLVFVNAAGPVDMQRLMTRIIPGNTVTDRIIPVEPSLIVTATDFKIYEWTWKHAIPPPSNNERPCTIPPGGWKQSFCFAVQDTEQKPLQSLLAFDTIFSQPPPPGTHRMTSQGSFLSGSLTGRESFMGGLTVSDSSTMSPLSAHAESYESGPSPRSSLSSPVSPPNNVAQFNSQSTILAGGHRRDLSSGTGSSMLNLDEVDDEPAFRSTIDALEKRTVNLKQAVKKTSKHVDEYISSTKNFAAAGRALTAAIAAIPSLDTAVIGLLKDVQQEVDRSTEILLNQLQGTFVAQLDLLYKTQIKAAEQQKKTYDQEAKDFNYSEQKYLSIKTGDKKVNEADFKWQEKKKNYELKRLDYFCHLKDLHGAHMERDLNFTFTVLLEKQMTYFRSINDKLAKKKEDLDVLSNKWKESNEKFLEEKKEREERRKLIENKAQLFTEGSVVSEVMSDEDSAKAAVASEEKGARFKGIRDLTQTHDPDAAGLGRRRKGYLFVAVAPTTGGTPKTPTLLSWKKLWCVLSGGLLQECTLKKNSMEVITTVNIRVCAVREARNVDRRFAFELIGPQIGRRIYQASDAEDVKAWMSVIQNSIEGMLTGTSTFFETVQPEYSIPFDRVNRGLTISLEHMPSGDWELQVPGKVLEIIRDYDASNSVCAECTSRGPDWISINLGCVICIDCSGIHRSLGTHITKIRSLTLDTVTWTPELMAVFKAIGNSKFNAVWEASVPPDVKPSPTDRRDVKAQYITDKVSGKVSQYKIPLILYVFQYINRTFLDRAGFIRECPSEDPLKYLTKALLDKDITAATRAIAHGATADYSGDSVHPSVIAALGYPSPPPPIRRSSIQLGSAPVTVAHISSLLNFNSLTVPSPRLVMAEYLIQNGAKVNAIDKVPIPLGSNVLCSDQEATTKPIERGLSAIHYAALYLDLEAMSYLLAKGADPNLKDAFGKTTMELIDVGRKWKVEHDAGGVDASTGFTAQDTAGVCEERLREAIAKYGSR
ncbi:hypothetical protein DFS34DRAFT_337330 [Phlyctochytrium arcticum]|nr:hypothetical protein DFS34DRAFT_337330 [Phlyctochytrium arcticum]